MSTLSRLSLSMVRRSTIGHRLMTSGNQTMVNKNGATSVNQPNVARINKTQPLSINAPTISRQQQQRRQVHSTRSFNKVVQFKLADIGEGIAEVEMLKWHVKEGDRVTQFQMLCEVRSDKANAEITSRFDGVIKKLHSKEGDIVKVGSALVDIETEAADAPAAAANAAAEDKSQSSTNSAASSPSSNTSGSTASSDGKVLASPATRRMAAKHSIKFSDVKPKRDDGRVTKADLSQHMQAQTTSSTASEVSQQPQQPQQQSKPQSAVASTSGASITIPADRVVPLTGYARAMFKSMTAASTVPHFGYSEEIEVDALMQVRDELKSLAQQQGVKLTYMPFFIKAMSMALRQFPQLNAIYDDKQNAVIHRGAHNIGVAVDTPLGLVVPNIKNVQQLSVLEVAQELNRLVDGAKKGTLKTADLTGGTITLSNVGNIGGTYTSPVLVVPEVVIGALGAIRKLPRFDAHGQVRPAHILYVSWSADHRVVDGVTVASFSNLWKSFLERPSRLLLQMK